MIINLSPTANLNLSAPPYDTEGLTGAVVANKGGGKSNLLAVIAEEFHAAQIPFIFYDPNGDAASLRELGRDVIVVGDTTHEEPSRRAYFELALALDQAKDFIHMVIEDGYSIVVDLKERVDVPPHPLEVFTALMNQHFYQSSRLREPCAVLIDEAHMFAPQSGASKLEVVSRKALRRLATDGRKRGVALVTATTRSTFIDKGVLFGANVRIFGKITYHPDYKVIQPYVPASFQQMKNLTSGEVYIVTENRYGKTRIKLRSTTDLGQTPAFAPRPARARPDVRQLEFSFKDLHKEKG